jgi:hypothetical protein
LIRQVFETSEFAIEVSGKLSDLATLLSITPRLPSNAKSVAIVMLDFLKSALSCTNFPVLDLHNLGVAVLKFYGQRDFEFTNEIGLSQCDIVRDFVIWEIRNFEMTEFSEDLGKRKMSEFEFDGLS